MRIAVVCESGRRQDGVGRYATWLAQSLRDEQHDVIELRPGWSPRRSTPRWIELPGNGSTFEVPLGRPALRLSEPLDVLHIQAPYSQWTQQLVSQAGRETAVVATFHSAPRGRREGAGLRVIAAYGRRTTRRVDAAIAVSPAAEAGATAAGQDVEFILGPVVPAAVTQGWRRSGQQRRPGTVLFVGRLSKRKGAVPLVREFGRLSPHTRGWRLRIAGAGAQAARLTRVVEDLDLTACVDRLGAIDERSLAQEMATAEVVCAPSLYGESFGMVLLEAMAAGAVAVGGANLGHAHVLHASQVADVTEPGAYAAMLYGLLTDSKRRATALADQQTLLAHYRARAQRTALVDIYAAAISRRRSKNKLLRS